MGEKVKVGPKYQVVIPRSIREKVPIEPKFPHKKSLKYS